MTFYVISKQSFLMRYENLKKKDQGQYAWFFRDGIFNYLLDYEGAKYLFQEPLEFDSEIMKIKRDLSHSILGIVEYDDLFPKEEPQEEVVVDEDFVGLVPEEV